MRARLVWRIALLLTIVLGASVLPTIDAQAKVGDTAPTGHASVDMYYQWSVSASETTETVQLNRFELGAVPTSDGWGFAAQVSPDVPTPSYGRSVAVGRNLNRDNPLIVVGAPDADLVFLYQSDGLSITPITTISGPPGSRFGASVDTAAGLVLIGAPGDDGGRGSAYIYDRFGVSLGLLTEPSADADAAIGTVVQLEGDQAWVGAPGQQSATGMVLVFDTTTATLLETLTPNAPVAGMGFGSLLSADPARALIGGSGLTSAFLQQGFNQTEIFSPTGSVIADVALEGNLIAFDNDQVAGRVEVLTDNGTTGTFVPFTLSNNASADVQEIVLGGGWLHMAATPGFDADPNRVIVSQHLPDLARTDKFVPHLGWEQTQFGNYIDVDATTMISTRGSATSRGQVVVSERIASSWGPTEWTARQFLDLSGPAAGGFAIEGNVFAISIGDFGNVGNPNVAIYERASATSPFVLLREFRTESGRAPRSVAIDATGQYLALGLPTPVDGAVEVHAGGPAAWGAGVPQQLAANDSAGNGPGTFGWDVDFGEGFLAIGKPGTTSLTAGSALAGAAEQWRIDDATGQIVFFSDYINAAPAPGDAFGWSVEIEQEVRAIGAPGTNTVFVNRPGLGDATLVDPSPAGNAFWGYALDIADGVLAVTDWTGDTVAYDVYATSVTQLATFQATDAEQSDYAASSFPLATSEGTVMVGARLEDWQGRDAGAAYIFSVPTSEPPTLPRIWPTVVDIDNGTAVVGNAAQDTVHVLRNTGAGWTEVQQLLGVAGTSFGAGVALEGDVLIIGSPDAQDRAGLINRYDRGDNGLFLSTDFAINPSGSTTDKFGSQLDISGGWVIAGAPIDGTSATAVIYDLNLGNPTVLDAGFGGAITGSPIDEYGAAVALGRGTINGATLDIAWVGAPSGTDGIVYGYYWDGAAWQTTNIQQGTTPGDRFGSSLESNGLELLTSAPGDGTIGYVQLSTWDSSGPKAGATTLDISAGDVVINGDVLAAATTAGSINLFSDNGQDANFAPIGTAAGTYTGTSIAVDGDWIIGATAGTGTDWTQLASITTIGSQPNTPADKLTPANGTDAGRFGQVVEGSDDTWVVASPAGSDGLAAGSLHIYNQATGTLTQTIVEQVVADGDYRDISIDGDRLAVLRPDGVEVLTRAGAGTDFAIPGTRIVISDIASVDLHGELLVLGQPTTNQVFVYAFDGTIWSPLPESPLTSAFSNTGASLGADVAVVDNTIVAGADFSLSSTDTEGFVAAWSRPDQLTAFSEAANALTGTEVVLGHRDGFGGALDFDGTWLVVGAPLEDRNGGATGTSPGVVDVFTYQGDGNFTNAVLLDPSGAVTGGDDLQARWGTDVAVRNNQVVVGGPGWTGTQPQQGALATYTYDALDGSWSLDSFIEGQGIAADADLNDGLGTSVAISASTAIGGAPAEDASGNGAGAAYTFTLNTVVPPAPRSWPNVVDMDNGWAVVGNPVQGTVHVLHNDGTGWVQTQELTDDPATSFGAGVALEGDRLYVGAPDDNGRLGVITAFVRNSAGSYRPVAGGSTTFSGATAADAFGTQIDVAGGSVIAGAPVPGASGAAVFYDLDLAAEITVVTTPAVDDGFGSAVAVSRFTGFRGAGSQFAWVGAPGALDTNSVRTGTVYAYWFDGTTWTLLGDSPGAVDGERRGAAIEGDLRSVLISSPERTVNGSLAVSTWAEDGLRGNSDRWSITSPADGDIAKNGHLFAVGSTTAGEIHVLSDNGTSVELVGVHQDTATGHSLAIDGNWLIGANQAVSTDWTLLVDLVDIGTIGAQPGTPANKIVPEFGTDHNRFGFIVDATPDTWVAVAPSWQDGLAPNSIEVYDAASTTRIQRISSSSVDTPIEDVSIDDNRLAVLDNTGFTILERSAAGLPFDVEAARIDLADGDSIDLDGDLLVVGDEQTNQVFPYELIGGAWQALPVLTSDSAAAADALGYDVAVNADVIVAAAPIRNTTAQPGYIAVWARPDDTQPFAEQPRLSAPDAVATEHDRLGRSLDFDGTWLVAGAPKEFEPAINNGTNPGNPGAVYVFAHAGAGAFDLGTRIDPAAALPGQHANAAWGHSVAVLEDMIAIGAPGHARDVGFEFQYEGGVAAYQFSPSLDDWALAEFAEGSRFANDYGRTDLLGIDVALTAPAIGSMQLIAGKPEDDASGAHAGAVYTFTALVSVEPEPDDKLISEVGADLTDAEIGDLFGYAMDTDGSRLVVGAPEWVSFPQPIGNVGVGGSGGVFVFTRAANGWDFEQYVPNPDETELTSEFGAAVAIDGDALLVGAPAWGGSTGAAFVFDLSVDPAGVVEITPDDLGGSSQYGSSVDIEGAVIAVGASGHDFDPAGNPLPSGNFGKLYTWELNGTWQVTFTQGGDTQGTQLGRSVAVDNGAVAVGTLGNSGSGYVEVFRRDVAGVSWVADPRIVGPSSGVQFGAAIALDGDHLVVGAPNGEFAMLHTWDGVSWGTGLSLTNPSAETNDDFGSSVAIDGTLIVIGEQQDTATVERQGRIHVFGNTGIGEWTLLNEFAAPDPGVDDWLGRSVAVSGDMIVGGAPFDDNNNGLDAGSAYYWSVTPPAPPVDPVLVTSLEYTLPTSVMPGATSVTIDGAEITAVGNSTATAGVVAASIGSVDLTEAPNGTSATENPFSEITLGEMSLATLGLDALRDIPLTEFPIDGGWASKLVGTQFEGVPLQAVTLGDVYNLSSVQAITLGQTDIGATPLRYTDIAAIGLGGVELLSIDLDVEPPADTYTEWCTIIEQQGTTCADLGIAPGSTVTLGSLSAAGVNIEATPLRYTPLRYTYIEASPLRYTPLRYTDIEASPLRYTPLRYTGVEASPLRYTPLRYTPLRYTPLRYTPLRYTPLRYTDIDATPLRYTVLADTANPGNITTCDPATCVTIGDAFDAGLLLAFELNDLGDAVLDGLQFDDIIGGIDQDSLDALLTILDDDTLTLGDLIDEFGGDLDAALGDLTLGEIDAEAFNTVAELLGYTVDDLLSSLPADILDDFTIADFLLLFMPRSAYEWDAVDLSEVTLQTVGMQAPLTAAISFTTTDGPATSTVQLVVDLPADAAYAANTAAITAGTGRIASVDAYGDQIVISVSGVSPDAPNQLTYGLLQGLTLGTSTSVATATAASSTMVDSGSISVIEAFEPGNDDLAGSIPIVSDNLYLSHVGSSGDLDYFRVTVTTPATTVSVQLANLAADFDLVVYGPKLGSIIPSEDGAAASAPDTDFGVGGSGTLSPVPLNDLPTSLDELQVYGASYFRGTDAEQVDFLALEPGDYFIQVSGYLGASSPQPYTLRAAVIPTTELACPTRTFPIAGGDAGTSSSVSPAANAIVLMNRSRLEALYGPTETASIVAAAESLVASVNGGGNGVTADILDIDALAGADSAYAAWDGSPCSTIAVNNVVELIANAVLGIRATQDIDHLLIIGGDDVVPFARVKDATTIANEVSYTNTFASGSNNALRAAFDGSWLLTDDPYADQAPTPIANTDRVVYVPEIAMGRLVETPTEILTAIDHYQTFNGQLDPQTGFVAGYDFLNDGAAETGDNLEDLVSPGSVERLINETWSADQLRAGLDPIPGVAGDAPDALLIAAHFDHYNALPAAGNLSGTTTDLFNVNDAEAMDFSGSVLFSVGCHGGLSVSDVLVAPTGVVSKDWAQTFLGSGAAAFVGNTGYGYGDDTAVALSEALMADFAAGLSQYETVGEALLYAKQDYAADLTVYGAFDEKALMEATFYGIPWYRLSNTIVPEVVPDVPTEPAVTGGQSTTSAFDPEIRVTGDGTEDEIWSTPDEDGDDQVQVTNGYPILPRFEWEVTQQDPGNSDALELDARGVVLESLTTRDEINVDPATARAVYDLAANEPNSDATDVTFALAPAVNTYLTPEGIRQDVTMAVGAFEASSSDGSGTMRLFEEFEATVYYATSADAESTPPVIREVQSNAAGSTLNLSVRVEDASGIARVMALVTPTPMPNVPVTWQIVELDNLNGSQWQGDLAIDGANGVQWLVMAVDSVGNTAWSMSKDLAFDGTLDSNYAPVLFSPTAPDTPVVLGDDITLDIDVFDFDGSDDALSIVWDFGDGNSCTPGSGGTCDLVAPTDENPRGTTTATHAWTDPGVYPVTVTATDNAGRSDSYVIGPITVVSESPDGSATVNGWARITNRRDPLLPPGVWNWVKVNADVGYDVDPDDINMRFRSWAFDFRADGFTVLDVVDNTAFVEGTGTLKYWWSETPVVYRAVITERSRGGAVDLTLWEAGADPDTTPPLHQLNTRLRKRQSVVVSS